MTRLFGIICAAAILFVAVSGCERRDDGDIKIGAAGPMTGDQSKMGLDLRNAVELAVSEWNEKGGVLGKRVRMIPGDDQADPKQAVSIANKFINQKIVAVVGHWNSSCSIPASKYYQDADVVMITPATTNPRLTQQGFKNVFRVCGTDDQQGRVAAAYVLNNPEYKRIAVIHDKTAYGQGLADYFRQALGNRVEVVYYGGIVQRDADYKAVLTSIKETKADLYFFGGIYPEAGRLVRQAREIGMDIPMMTGDGVFDPTFLNIAGNAAEGTLVTFGKDPGGLPTAKKFIATYTRKYGDLGPYSIYAYDAANIILTAIRETGAIVKDPDTGKETVDIDGAKMAEYISDMTFKGAFGDISFDKNGDITRAPYVVWQVKDGKFTQVR